MIQSAKCQMFRCDPALLSPTSVQRFRISAFSFSGEMRSLCEVFIIGALLYLGWDIPFGQRVDQVMGKTPAVATGVSPANSSALAVPSANQIPRTALAPVTRTNAPPRQPFNTAVAPQPAATTSGSWMWDANHHSPLDPPHKAVTPH